MLAFMPIGDLEPFENDPVIVSKMKEACHHNLYALANSMAMNGIGENTTIKATTPKPVATAKLISTVSIVVFVACLVAWIVRGSQFRKTEEYATWKAFKKNK